MAQYSYYSGGGPWGIGDGFVSLENETITQTLYFYATSPLGIANTRAKVWFAGNGVDAYQVQSAYLQQGAVSIPVTVNEQSSFLIPALGRWSDYSVTTSFTLPGNVSFVSVVKLKVPILIPIIGDGDSTQSGLSGSGVVTGYDDGAGIFDDQILILNFEGSLTAYDATMTDSSALVDEAHDASPTDALYLEQGTGKYGNGLKYQTDLAGTGTLLQYQNLPALGAIWQYQGWHYISGYNANNADNWTDFLGIISGWTNIQISYEDHTGGVNNGFVRMDVDDRAANAIANGVLIGNFPTGEWFHLAVAANGADIRVFVNGAVVWSGSSALADGFTMSAPRVYWSGYSIPAGIGKYITIDAVEIRNGSAEHPVWTATFTSPTDAPEVLAYIDTAEVTSTFTITVSDNTLVVAGDTITITEDSGSVVLTLVDIPTGDANEIVIGPDADTTAANIADTINDIAGSEFVATSSSNVVTVIKYTSDAVTVSDSSSGVTTGSVVQTVTYTSSQASSTIPSFTASGTGQSLGDMGDYYGLVNMAPFSASGAASMSGNNADIIMPAFTANALSTMQGRDIDSSDADKIALLMYENEWAEWFASLVAIPGDADDVALVASQWVANNITYVVDTTLDDWNDPRHTVYLGQGDCEDGAFLLASIIINSGVNPEKVRVYIGETQGAGHAWVEYQRQDDNQWVTLDWTEGATYWNAVSDVEDLDPLYPDIRKIIDLALDPDDQDYGSAVEYIDFEEVTPLGDTESYALSLYASAHLGNLLKSIGAITLSAWGGGYAALTIPSITLTSSGQSNILGNLAKSIPAITFTGVAFQETLGDLSASIPAIKISASGIDSPVGNLSKAIPAITLTASCFTDIMGSLSKAIGEITLTASAYWIGPNDGAMAIPAIRLTAFARAAEIITLCLNAKNFGLTKYTNYDYNSVCVFNGVLIGAKRTGVYELTGVEDNEVAIPWKVRTGKLDLKENRIRYVWLSGTVSGDIKMIVETADGERYEYDAEPWSETENEIKIKVGKGIRSRYLTLEFQNESTETITVDKIEVYGTPGERR